VSHPPVMEDSAVNLWPQTERYAAEESQSESLSDESWESSATGSETASIEIGGESCESVDNLACLLEDCQTTSSSQEMPIDHVVATAAEPTDGTEFGRAESAADTLTVHPHFGRVFDARELEFGAPS